MRIVNVYTLDQSCNDRHGFDFLFFMLLNINLVTSFRLKVVLSYIYKLVHSQRVRTGLGSRCDDR